MRTNVIVSVCNVRPVYANINVREYALVVPCL